MKRRIISQGILSVVLFLALTQQISQAAYLRLLDKNTNATPQRPELMEEECVKDRQYHLHAGGNGWPDGHTGFAFAKDNATLVYEDCQSSQDVYGGASALTWIQFVIEPTGTEKVGDCITVAFIGNYSGSATADGTATFEVGAGGQFVLIPPSIHLVGVSSSEILLNGSPVFSYGPTISYCSSFNDTRVGRLYAKIGDQIVLQVGAASLMIGAARAGSGTAKSYAGLDISVDGPCPVIPALSPWGMLAFACMLVCTAWFLLRKRKAASARA